MTLGTSKLAVDGVVVVAEHGVYPLSPNGIMMRPHYEFFEKITNVYRSSGRAVPYFNDKELSWNWDWSKKMVDVSHELGFPLQGGSSLAVTWRIPSVEFPLGAVTKEAVSVGYGGVTSYDFHALETLQCMVERRKGGEVGVEWVQTYRKENFWKAYADGVWSQALMKSALSRSSTLRPGDPTFTHIFPTVEQMKAMVPRPSGVSLQASRWLDVHDDPDERYGARLYVCRDDRGAVEALLHADVSADAGWTDYAGELLQPAGP